jgi:hypothetical protein
MGLSLYIVRVYRSQVYLESLVLSQGWSQLTKSLESIAAWYAIKSFKLSVSPDSAI